MYETRKDVRKIILPTPYIGTDLLFFDYRILEHLLMQLCADVGAVRQKRKCDEKLFFGFEVAEGGIFAFDFDNFIVFRFHFILLIFNFVIGSVFVCLICIRSAAFAVKKCSVVGEQICACVVSVLTDCGCEINQPVLDADRQKMLVCRQLV